MTTNNKKVVKVRKMVEADLVKINEVDNLLFGEKRVRTWPFPFSLYWNSYGPGTIFVAEVGKQLVGFLAGNIADEGHSQSILDLMHAIGRSHRHPKIGWVDMIGVLPEFQHQKVGQALVEAFQKECKDNNAPMRAIIKGDDTQL
ncbi:MAG: GNAT family N-acetyltransferase, partial [Planctomycetes bacterium]|nr:GNAT family N-acetyltransferase [Planctomycetota bacterium]